MWAEGVKALKMEYRGGRRGEKQAWKDWDLLQTAAVLISKEVFIYLYIICIYILYLFIFVKIYFNTETAAVCDRSKSSHGCFRFFISYIYYVVEINVSIYMFFNLVT